MSEEVDPPCAIYDPAGLGCGAEADGLPQCAMCGHPHSAHTVTRQLVEVTHDVRCAKTGNLVESQPTGERAWLILHECGEWTWEDANYCAHCGQEVEAVEDEDESCCEDDDE